MDPRAPLTWSFAGRRGMGIHHTQGESGSIGFNVSKKTKMVVLCRNHINKHNYFVNIELYYFSNKR